MNNNNSNNNNNNNNNSESDNTIIVKDRQFYLLTFLITMFHTGNPSQDDVLELKILLKDYSYEETLYAFNSTISLFKMDHYNRKEDLKESLNRLGSFCDSGADAEYQKSIYTEDNRIILVLAVINQFKSVYCGYTN